MNNLEIIGNNLVGRMYRPHKILNSDKRGFIFHVKYKSNFGGDVKKLFIEFNLEYNTKKSTEVVKIDIKSEEELNTMVRGSDFVTVNKLTAKQKVADRHIEGIRNIIKPDTYNIAKKAIPAKIRNDKGVLFVDIYIDSNVDNEKDVLKLSVYPSIIEDTEYIIVEGNGITPIVVRCEDGIRII